MQSCHVSGLVAERVHQWCLWCNDTKHSGEDFSFRMTCGSKYMNCCRSFRGCVGSPSKSVILFPRDLSSQAAFFKVKGQSKVTNMTPL